MDVGLLDPPLTQPLRALAAPRMRERARARARE